MKQLLVQRINDFVFEDPEAYYWTFDRWFPKLVKKAKLRNFSVHDLRKTCNTLMKNAGVSIEAAMKVLGHTTAMVNQRHYTGVLTELQMHAINSLPSIG